MYVVTSIVVGSRLSQHVMQRRRTFLSKRPGFRSSCALLVYSGPGEARDSAQARKDGTYVPYLANHISIPTW